MYATHYLYRNSMVHVNNFLKIMLQKFCQYLFPDGSLGPASKNVCANPTHRLHRHDRLTRAHTLRGILVEDDPSSVGVRRHSGGAILHDCVIYGVCSLNCKYFLIYIIFLQFLAMTWYCISYIPYARDAVSKCFNGLF